MSARPLDWRTRTRRALLPALLGALLLPLATRSATLQEYQLKALYLYNFSIFVSWPPRWQSGAPFVYCAAVRDRTTDALEKLLRGEVLDGHPLALRYMARGLALSTCRVLYLNGLSAAQRRAVITRAGRLPILTVAEDPGALDEGGIVALVRKGRRIRIFINPRAASRRGLRVDSKLLGIARLIGEW